jgi:alpha-beta hydrolase superfamily lysophospholipase
VVFFLPLFFNAVMFKEIEFKSSRSYCRGRLYEPDKKNSNGAGVVLAHGFVGTMDAGLFPYAEAFAKAGFHALVFDYRGFGLSDGTPRQYISVPQQRADWARAIAELRSHANVDADRIGLWGISFSGGHVIHMAHKDPIIRAVVAQVPSIDPILAMNIGNYERGRKKTLAVQKQVLARAKSRMFFKKAEMMRAAPTSDKDAAVLAAKEAQIYPKLGGPSWRNELHPDSFITGKLDENNASLLTDDLTAPMLIQMGKDDRLVSNEAIGNFARRCGPLATLTSYDAGHFTMLQNNRTRKKAIDEAIGFYKGHLIL